jgi:putative protein kinase ArgK-like GTPase of G3E family
MSSGDVTHFAHLDFRNDQRRFGIKDDDRFAHIYIIGKTGTGKSSLLETMALQDIRRNVGLALIDPHRHTTHVAKRTRMTQKRIDVDLAMSSWRKRNRLLMIAVS